jgi:homocysteine S-methyltransferase
VAASVGPYGAVLADGSEYSGHYDINADELVDFHLPRWQILAGTDADLFACETIPSRREGRALLRLLANTPEVWAWLSFSCQDGQRLSNGSAMVDVARDCDAVERVAAIGVNCTAPEFVTERGAGVALWPRFPVRTTEDRLLGTSPPQSPRLWLAA